ncbi:MAG: trypsin-like peptidase domain-containing protein [Clostridia bacterium]|nr:trypsin-like peptidase domain-containing protein [Clostridia bacterium]
MEENKDMLPEEADERAQDEMQEVASDEREPSVDSAEPTEPSDVVQDSVPEAPWDFGVSEPRERSKGKGAFFGIFSAVLALCLALVIGLLFVGENGFHIVRTVEILRTVYTKTEADEGAPLSAQETADIVARSTVTVVSYISQTTANGTQVARASGSGFVYDDKGHICTNHHVIDGATRVQIMLSDGTAIDAELVGSDARSDLAVLKADPARLTPATLGTSVDLLVGDSVVAVGTPLGAALSGTATFGRISCTDRWLAVDDDGNGVYEKKIRVIQTDTAVNPGNSGGPMADMYGRVVGIVVRKISGKEAIGFAIPIDGAKTVIDAIIKNGAFTGQNPLVEGRSLIGVTGHGGQKGVWYTVNELTGAVNSSSVEKPGYHYMPVDGVYVMSVDGANAAGVLYSGDVILAANGLLVYDTPSLIDAVNLYRVGQRIKLDIWRGDTVMTVEITLAEG